MFSLPLILKGWKKKKFSPPIDFKGMKKLPPIDFKGMKKRSLQLILKGEEKIIPLRKGGTCLDRKLPSFVKSTKILINFPKAYNFKIHLGELSV